MAKQVASSAQIVQNWMNAMSNPATGAKYTAGINRVTDSPMEKAASQEAQQRYIQGVQSAVSSGKMATNLRAVTLQAWKAQATGVGAQRFASGAQKGQAKYTSALAKWQPIYQEASNAAQALPKGGLANAQARWLASVQVMMRAAGKA